MVIPVRRPPRVALALVATALAGALQACGGSSETSEADRVLAAREGSPEPVAVEARFVERKLVSDSEVRKARPGTLDRAFLEYWAAIDREDWGTAVLFLSDELRRALRPEYLPLALRLESQNNHPVKPVIRGVRKVRGQTSVAYFTRRADCQLRPTSVSMKRIRGDWFITFSSTLGESYGAGVQQSVQGDLDPTAKTPSNRAIAAGNRAAREQSRTLAPGSSSSARSRP